MTDANNSISAIESLLAERRRYEGWLATLETRRETTPAHVYERVRTDYEARLVDVLERLGGRSTDLRQMVDTLSGKVTSLESDETTRRDSLAEAELRALVGEYEAEEWEKLKAERDAEIQRLAKERDAAKDELARIQELLSAANAEPRFATPAPGVQVAPPSAPQAVPQPQPAAVAPAPRPEPQPIAASAPPAPSAPVPGATVPPAPAAAPSSFDELAFLQSLSDAGASGGAQPAASGPPAMPPARPAAPVAEAARALADDLASRPFGTPADQPVQRSTVPAMRPTTAQPVAPVADQRTPQPAEPRRNEVPSFLRDVPSEQVKTLKCQECGTMNYPTEWYCERCGGELAAM
jgi:hypothetical protein